MEEFVNVSVRIRPTFSEGIPNSCLQVINTQPAVLLVLDRGQAYNFDNIFTDEVQQEDVYNDTVKCLVEKVKAGYNCTVFAYGQTGTGKTYTIGTNPDIKNEEECGLISRTLKDFFCSSENENKVEIAISFIEIYNEKVFDLLAASNKVPLQVKGFVVQGFTKVRVHDDFEALLHLKNGSRKRHTGDTKQNAKSSRSHAIFSIYCHSRNSEMELETIAKLNLVDLAGSESVKKTGNRGSSFFEGININKGLLSLGQVMTALSTNSNHVPYRQSVITTILQDSLNKKNFVSLIACVSSHSEDLGETLQTLEFSKRVKKMKNKPEVNEFILQYKKENPNLFPYCISRGLTPSKRPSASSYETPFKKPRNVLPIIREPGSSINSSEISPLANPLFSSSMYSLVSETPQSFSPVVKKYVNAMESSIMSKLENVIKNTLGRSRIRKSYTEKEEKENTFNLRISSHIDNGASENSQICCDTSFRRRNYSITADNEQIIKTHKLQVDENDNSPPTHRDERKIVIQDDSFFKVPAPKHKHASKRCSEMLQLKNQSPEMKLDVTHRRRSVRLQAKNQSVEEELNDTHRRRSVRLQTKNQSVEEELDDTHRTRSVRLDAKKKTNDVNMKNVDRRRSVRIQNKKGISHINSCSPETITKNKKLSSETCLVCASQGNKKTAKLKASGDSPVTFRTKQVLNVLNYGTIRELEKLHTIGAKTAEKIEFFRQLKGPFKSVSDIAEMPYWTKRKYDKFLTENFL